MYVKTILKLTPLLAALLLPMGCTPPTRSVTAGAQCGGGKQCTVTVSTTWTWPGRAPVQQVAPADLAAAVNAGYEVILTVPPNELTPDTSSVAQATLNATTDTGYTSSILVNLTPTGSAPSTLVSGDTDYTYSVPASNALTNWVNTVNQNTNETSSIDASTSTVFTAGGIAGTYTVYVQVTSQQTGTMPAGNATFTDVGTPTKPIPCHTSNCPNQE